MGFMQNVSELHKRLSHLVNYSSQLIFVSGNTIADQQRTLSDFLSSQQDNTEISFFSASSSKQASDYRGAICRQLGGHKVGSFIRPLQQLLSSSEDGLSKENGPYLVCITQAEALDSEFLQELWDWVMHSQQVNADIHLNIILFGESAWAKKSQEWLPVHNSHKPVLLSSELVDPVGFDVNALEALMADKSSWFGASNQPLVTNKWFISSVLSVFLIVFAGLMVLQYPKQFSLLLSGAGENTNPIPDLVEDELIYSDDNIREAIVDEAFLSVPPGDEKYQAQVEIIEADNAGEGPKEQEKTPQSITDKLLVTSWPNSVAAYEAEQTTELKALDAAPVNMKEQIETLPSNAITRVQTTQANKLDSNTLAQRPKTAQQESKADAEGDFQVPDIISVEQLDAQFNLKESFNIVPAADTAAEIAPPAQQAPETNKTSIDYQFDETTLLSLPIDSIVLQLSGIQNPVVLENYLNNNNLKASTWVYETQRYGGPWYVVLYRQSFNSLDAALEQLSSLPADVKEAQPFAKSINQIQQEISRR
jgi:DamX protein